MPIARINQAVTGLFLVAALAMLALMAAGEHRGGRRIEP